jgi:predicted ferric reductase
MSLSLLDKCMNSTPKTNSKLKIAPGLLIFSTILITLIIWIGSKIYYQNWLPSNIWYISKIAALSATMLMSWSLILATRAIWLEQIFGGLDKMYKWHKKTGKYAFYFILVHPLSLASFLGFQSWSNYYSIGHNFGLFALLSMFVLIGLSLWVYLPYHLWKATHSWFGIAYTLVIVHVILVDANIAAYPLLRVWMYAWMLFALGSYVYIKFGYYVLGPKSQYLIKDIEYVDDVYEITLKTTGSHVNFRPSQFCYLRFHSHNVTKELHPYSIACAPNEEGRLKFGIKAVGDHTRSLSNLKIGDKVDVFGPYGKFSEKFLLSRKECVFIGGGIGVTPFLGMWDTALNSSERIKFEEHSRLISFHPDHLKAWKSPCVNLFYVVKNDLQASFDNDIKHIAIVSQHRENPHFHSRGHRYILHTSDNIGRLSMEQVQDHVGSLKDKNIFLCGPQPMMQDLIQQAKELGVPNSQIITEDFAMLDEKRGQKGLAKLLSLGLVKLGLNKS